MTKIDVVEIIRNLSGNFKVLCYEEKNKSIYVFVESNEEERKYSIFKILEKDKQTIPVLIDNSLKEAIKKFNELIN